MERANRQTAVDFIRNRVEFKASNFEGHNGRYYGWGRLPNPLRARINADKPVYVVYSYTTPIAWLPAGGEGWVVPTVKYSPTTHRHQSAVALAVGEDVTWLNSDGEEVGGRWAR